MTNPPVSPSTAIDVERACMALNNAATTLERENHPFSFTHLAAELRALAAALSSQPARIEEAPKPWTGAWNDWIAPFHVCPRCNASLNWKQGEDVFDNPVIETSCCGIKFFGKMAWQRAARSERDTGETPELANPCKGTASETGLAPRPSNARESDGVAGSEPTLQRGRVTKSSPAVSPPASEPPNA